MTSTSLVLPGRYYRTYPGPAPQAGTEALTPAPPLGHTEELLELALDRTVFLIVDVYGLGPGGEEPPDDLPPLVRNWLEFTRAIVRDHIVPAKRAAKSVGIPVIYLTNHLSEALNEQSELRNVSLRCDGIDLLEAWHEPSNYLAHSDIIAPGEGDIVVKKQHYSGFFDTDLDSILRGMTAPNLVTVGFESRVCLGNTVTEAMYRNYRVVAIRDAIATREEVETAEQGWANFLAVRFIENHVGYTCTTEQWLRACERCLRDRVYDEVVLSHRRP